MEASVSGGVEGGAARPAGRSAGWCASTAGPGGASPVRGRSLCFRARLDRVATEVGSVAERLHRTFHRGIYRQGDLWAVPYYDSRDVERVRRFDDLGEARRLRRRQGVIESDKLAELQREKERFPATPAGGGVGDGGGGGGG